LSIEAKRQAVIGHAYIDRSRCIPWVSDRNCIVCEEMCPVPEKAIKLQEEEVVDGRGGSVVILRPWVQHDLCIGCGICEYQCPLAGRAAIRVHVPSGALTAI
jgi:ferredoxin